MVVKYRLLNQQEFHRFDLYRFIINLYFVFVREVICEKCLS